LGSYIKWSGMDSVLVPHISLSGKSLVPAWTSVLANSISGTDGSMFHQNLQEGEEVSTFVSDIYRELGLEQSGKVKFKDVTLYRYTIPAQLMQNESNNPLNAPYFMTKYNGVFNLSTCYYGGSIFFTKPHFLDGDDSMLTYVENMTAPDRDTHDTRIDVEPLSGITMQANKRMQVNVLVGPYRNPITSQIYFAKLVPYLFPLVWFQEAGNIPDDKAHQFVSGVYGAQQVAYYSKWIGFVAGVLLICGGLFSFWFSIFWAGRHPMDESVNSYKPTDD